MNVFLSRDIRCVTHEANIEPCKRLLLSGATEKRGITSTFPDDATAIHGPESPRVRGMPLSLTLTCVFLCAYLCRRVQKVLSSNYVQPPCDAVDVVVAFTWCGTLPCQASRCHVLKRAS